MPYCPDCGTSVAPEDRFCNECGAALDAAGERDAPSEQAAPDRSREAPADRARDRREPADRPGEHRQPTDPPGEQPTDHRQTGPAGERTPRATQSVADRTPAITGGRLRAVLVGAALVSLLGLAESGFDLLYTEEALTFYDLGPEFETVLVVTAAVGVVVALAVLALSGRAHANGRAGRRYFWVLLGVGIAGFVPLGILSFLLFIPLGAYGLYVLRSRRTDRA